ncbi:MAG: ornithine carbamoyltransferase [Planctomycetota bacterium]|nr:ornithine carbamoyltransferase [Planctomycetota bacterium]
MRHLLSLQDLTQQELQRILEISSSLKVELKKGSQDAPLQGHNLALIFEKQSLRTRVSFEAGMAQLGGASIFLGQEAGWGKREAMKDFAEVLGEYVDAVACRTYAHATVASLAGFSNVPVINALTDFCHPCQALADVFTIGEQFGGLDQLAGRRVAFIGDGNNVSRSLAIACIKLGMHFTLACPKRYQFDSLQLKQICQDCPDMEVIQTDDPQAAVEQADAIYTDVWSSMGQEEQEQQRKQDFAEFQVNEALLEIAPPESIFLHCLPARRGQEVTDAVIDGSRSRVVVQAGNRMHAQKGLLLWLLQEVN